MKSKEFIKLEKTLNGKEFKFDFHNGNIVNENGMVISRYTVKSINWDEFDGDNELEFSFIEKRGFTMDNLCEIEDWNFIKKTGEGYKIYFGDIVLYLDKEMNVIKKMNAYFE